MYDEERTIFIESSGVNVLRFKNEDIENRIEWVINKIIKKIEKSSLSPLGETGKGVVQGRDCLRAEGLGGTGKGVVYRDCLKAEGSQKI